MAKINEISRRKSSKQQLNTPDPVQARVVARHMEGQSNREIAAAEGVDRGTVSRILTQPDIEKKIVEYRSRMFSIVPEAIDVFEECLRSDDLRLKGAMAMKIVERFHVLPGPNDPPPPPPPVAAQQRLWLTLGQICEASFKRSEKFGTPLPPKLEALKSEYTQRRHEEESPGAETEP